MTAKSIHYIKDIHTGLSNPSHDEKEDRPHHQGRLSRPVPTTRGACPDLFPPPGGAWPDLFPPPGGAWPDLFPPPGGAWPDLFPPPGAPVQTCSHHQGRLSRPVSPVSARRLVAGLQLKYDDAFPTSSALWPDPLGELGSTGRTGIHWDPLGELGSTGETGRTPKPQKPYKKNNDINVFCSVKCN